MNLNLQKKFCSENNLSPTCCELGGKLAEKPEIKYAAQQHPDSIDAICYYLEKQPFTAVKSANSKTVQNYPTTDCNREDIHIGCSFYLNNILKLKQ